MTRRTLVLGGTRSGKSAHAESLMATGEPVTYVATGRRDPADMEWAARIDAHAARRPLAWRTVEIETPPDLANILHTAGAGDHLLIDDIAIWLTGVLDDEGAWDGGPAAIAAACQQADALVAAVAGCAARVVLVSAEVGLGVIPTSRSGRLFQDELGTLNRRLAVECDDVLLLVAGIPLRLKPTEPMEADR